MPKRTDIKRILVIGSGPIVIGQACEFDYSGAQACKVLKEDGFEVILVNSNPATIMTDPGLADRTYVEPITAEFIERVIKKERPDALLPTLGGQTGLNAAVELAKDGTLDKYGVEMIGCDLAAIERGEDRKLFNEAMAEIGLEVARSGYAYSVADAEGIAERVGYPCVLRPSFTLGGAGGGIAHTHEELVSIVGQGLELSPALHFGQIGVGLEHRLEKVPHRKPHAASVDERALGHLVPRHPGPERRRPEGRPVAAFAARTAQGPAHGLEGMLGMHARLILEDKHARTSREARRNGGEARPGDEFGRRRCAERGGKEDFVHGSSLHRWWEECRDSTESSAHRGK